MERVDITKPCRWLMNLSEHLPDAGQRDVDITKPCRWLMNPRSAGGSSRCRHVDITKPCRWLMKRGVSTKRMPLHSSRKYQAFTMADETEGCRGGELRSAVANTKPLRWLMKRCVLVLHSLVLLLGRKYQAFTMADETLPFQTPDYSTCPTL